MPPQNTATLVRLGIFGLPLAGLLSLVGALGNLGSPDPNVDPRGAAQAVSTTGYFLTQFVGNVLAITLAIFGLLALFAQYSRRPFGVLSDGLERLGTECDPVVCGHSYLRHPGFSPRVPERPRERYPNG